MAAYLGLVSYNWPDADAGFASEWSVAVMAWAVAVGLVSWWPVRGSMSRVSDDQAWVCEHCGEQGRTSEPIDTVQCPRCGEPVVPMRSV